MKDEGADGWFEERAGNFCVMQARPIFASSGKGFTACDIAESSPVKFLELTHCDLIADRFAKRHE